MFAAMFPKDDVKIIDCIAEKIDYKRLFNIMQDFKPTWVISIPISSVFSHDMIVVHYAKSLGAKTIIISPHAKALKEEVHERFPSLDYIIDFSKGDCEPEQKLRKLIRSDAPFGSTFKELPIARQDLLPLRKYDLPFIGKNFTFVIVSRGCPYSCIYCRSGISSEKQVRYRPVNSVIEEIKEHNLTNIALHADTATLDKDWMYEFCTKVPKDVKWICNSRVDTVDQDLLNYMGRNGCWMICYGIESGNDNVLKMNKKGATVEQAKKATAWAKKAKIKVWGYFMLGLYGDTKETMDDTINFACEGDFDIVNFSIAAPYPGTEWQEIAKTKKWLVDDRWESYDQNYSCQVSQPDCSAELVKRYQRKAYFKWFFSYRGIKFIGKELRIRYVITFFKIIRDHLKLWG